MKMTDTSNLSSAQVKDGPPVRLRTYRSTDFDTLYEIDQVCFPAGISYGREELANFIKSPHSMTWVAEAGQVVVGFVIADRENDEIAHIITIDVVEKWRHRGVGTELMNTAEDWAARMGVRFVYLETAEENLVAQQFYRSRGYKTVERVANYYASGQAAWVMVKWMN